MEKSYSRETCFRFRLVASLTLQVNGDIDLFLQQNPLHSPLLP